MKTEIVPKARFECRECDNHFETFENLTHHRRSEHDENQNNEYNRSTQCSICDKIFRTYRGLKLHTKR